jgi:hypothetical protein
MISKVKNCDKFNYFFFKPKMNIELDQTQDRFDAFVNIYLHFLREKNPCYNTSPQQPWRKQQLFSS